MTAITHQRRELIDTIIEKWQSIYSMETDNGKRHMMIVALLRAYAHELPINKLKEWHSLLRAEHTIKKIKTLARAK